MFNYRFLIINSIERFLNTTYPEWIEHPLLWIRTYITQPNPCLRPMKAGFHNPPINLSGSILSARLSGCRLPRYIAKEPGLERDFDPAKSQREKFVGTNTLFSTYSAFWVATGDD